MREIKFRLWDKDYNYMIEPEDIHPRVTSECITGDGKVLEVIENNSYMGTDINFDDISNNRILMQYTGLKDKNGKEIYEGDIVTNKTKIFSGNGFKGKDLIMLVEWYQGECFYSLSVYDEEYWGLKKLTKSSASDIEVIGNIYDNPELIRK